MGAQADEAQASAGENRRADIQGSLHQNRREDIRQDVPPDDRQAFHADAARSLLDGHVVLSREMADRGHYPAVDSLASVSAVTSSNGRIFYILDEGDISLIHRPSKWKLIARDAFNGKLLWKRPIEKWGAVPRNELFVASGRLYVNGLRGLDGSW